MNKNNKIQIKENTTSSSGEYNGPIELGLKKWKKSELFPFINESSHKTNKKSKNSAKYIVLDNILDPSFYVLLRLHSQHQI